MLPDHRPQRRDLLVQGPDDLDLRDDDRRVGALQDGRLPQCRAAERRHQRVCFGLHVMAAGGPQRGCQLGAGQLRGPARIWCPLQQRQCISARQVLEKLHCSGKELTQCRAQP